MKILAIESSCDETAASVIEGQGDRVTVLSNVVSSQITIHQKYGGVVPEVAAREHVHNIIPVVHEVLQNTYHISHNTEESTQQEAPLTRKPDIDAIAVTAGPGLITSLAVGVETARTLAYAWQIPLVVVNHISGHIYANWISHISHNTHHVSQQIEFPAVIMTVSGGHNMLILMRDHLDFEVIGDTLDDAAGEAFDKAAKMLGLGYPGGPAVAASAASINNYQLSIINLGVASREINLPRPMINSNDFNFSFSGLKTALLYTLKKDADWQNRIPEYASEFQQAVVDTLIFKTIKATKKFNAKTVLLAGGVSANLELRQQLELAVTKQLPGVSFGLPDLKYTTDNAAMIASAGYFLARAGRFTSWQDLKVDSNLDL